jgi:hypothetical protein
MLHLGKARRSTRGRVRRLPAARRPPTLAKGFRRAKNRGSGSTPSCAAADTKSLCNLYREREQERARTANAGLSGFASISADPSLVILPYPTMSKNTELDSDRAAHLPSGLPLFTSGFANTPNVAVAKTRNCFPRDRKARNVSSGQI